MADPTDPTPDTDLALAANGLVYIIEDRVALDVPNFGRLEFHAPEAEQVAAAIAKGAKMLREGSAKDGQKILVT